MTRYEELTDKISANTDKLLGLDPKSIEAEALRHDQTELLTAQLAMTPIEAEEIVHDPVFTPAEMKEKLEALEAK